MSVDPKTLRGKYESNVSLARLTSWRVGGQVAHYFQPADLQDLQTYLQQMPSNQPVHWLGLGSNTLVNDASLIKGTVIHTLGGLKQMALLTPTTIRAEAGVSCAQLARFSARHGLTGLEFLAGVPGTVGGALRMNAGCFGGETWETVQQVEVIDKTGAITTRLPNSFKVSYRHVEGLNDEYFVAGQFELKPGDSEQSFEHIKTLLAKRNDSQPANELNCGSVFRNPEGDYAARLIESSGLKGYQQGGAIVSPKHANFIINQGQATAADIRMLIQHIQSEVEAKHGIKLQTEVHFLGF